MAKEDEVKDILGEEPIAHTPDGRPIYPAEDPREAIHGVVGARLLRERRALKKQDEEKPGNALVLSPERISHVQLQIPDIAGKVGEAVDALNRQLRLFGDLTVTKKVSKPSGRLKLNPNQAAS